MDKLNFKDMLAHYDPDRDDPDGYFQHRMRRRRSGVLGERTLTPAEKKKREEIAKAIERDHPNMPMDKKMAIATASAKRVAEEKTVDPVRSVIAKRVHSKRKCDDCKTNILSAILPIIKMRKGLEEATSNHESVQLDEISADLAQRYHDAVEKKKQRIKKELEKHWSSKPASSEEAKHSMDAMHDLTHKHNNVTLGQSRAYRRTLGLGPRNEEVELDEALSMAQRLKRSRIMKRVRKKIEMGQKRAKRRMANMKTLKRRAVKAARKKVLEKMTKGISKEDLSFARKQELEKRLDTPAMKKRIQMIAMKMLKDVRKREVERHRAKQ